MLAAYVEICGSSAISADYQQLANFSLQLLADSPPAQIVRKAFLAKYGAAFRMWALQSCSCTYGARRQLMWHMVVAKFFGLSRMGVRALSQFGVLGPLTSLDRTWKALLDKYMKTTWYPISYEFV